MSKRAKAERRRAKLRDDTALAKLIEQSVERVKAMTDDEREAMHKAQRESWVRGEMGIGNDADEARYREEHRKREIILRDWSVD